MDSHVVRGGREGPRYRHALPGQHRYLPQDQYCASSFLNKTARDESLQGRGWAVLWSGERKGRELESSSISRGCEDTHQHNITKLYENFSQIRDIRQLMLVL